jgi:hypothetical protein
VDCRNAVGSYDCNPVDMMSVTTSFGQQCSGVSGLPVVVSLECASFKGPFVRLFNISVIPILLRTYSANCSLSCGSLQRTAVMNDFSFEHSCVDVSHTAFPPLPPHLAKNV